MITEPILFSLWICFPLLSSGLSIRLMKHGVCFLPCCLCAAFWWAVPAPLQWPAVAALLVGRDLTFWTSWHFWPWPLWRLIWVSWIISWWSSIALLAIKNIALHVWRLLLQHTSVHYVNLWEIQIQYVGESAGEFWDHIRVIWYENPWLWNDIYELNQVL